jgi:photosystem II stability/assembly factor-like uncharacterized protein
MHIARFVGAAQRRPNAFAGLLTGLLFLGGCGGGGSTPAPPAPAVVAPTIATPPANQTVTLGATATFSVTANGTAPLTYQWRRASTAIAGATGTSYTTPTTVAGDTGASFDVVVTNSAGSVTSAAATLTVTVPVTATITSSPAAVTVIEGATASFTVAATCSTGTPTYQWQKSPSGGAFANVAGATAATYVTPATVLADNASSFRAVATCGTATATSAAALLTVTAPPPPATVNACSGANSAGWCWVNPRPAGNDLNALRVDDANNAMVVGRGGTLLRTTDGGATWAGRTPLPELGADSRDLFDVDRVNASTLVAVATNRILRSTNDGATWSFVTPTLPVSKTMNDYEFRGVSFAGATGIAAAISQGFSLVVRTTDGGATWTSVLEPDRAIYGVLMLPSGIAFAYGEPGRIYRSTDGGASWTQVLAGGNALTSMSFVDANVGLAGGTSGLYRTTDAGATWTLVTTDTATGIDIRPNGVGLAVGSQFIKRTTDGGLTWTVVSTGIPSFSIGLRDVKWTSATTAIVIGQGGTILRTADAGLTWSASSSGTNPEDSQTPMLYSVDFGGPQFGVAVGQEGMIRSADAGSTWTRVAAFKGLLMRSVAFANATTAVALTQTNPAVQANFSRSTDGGATWTNVGQNAAWDLRFNSAGVGIAVGEQGGIWRSTDSGATWTTVTVGGLSAPRLNLVRWASDTVVLAASSSSLLRSTDAGLTWAAVTVPNNTFVQGLAFATATKGFAIGDDPVASTSVNRKVLLRTLDGGATWTLTPWSTLVTVTNTLPVQPTAIAFADAQTGVVVGSSPVTFGAAAGATLLRTTDGGATWTRDPSPSAYELNAIDFVSPTVGVAVGMGFSVVRTTTGGAP